jgi:PAS domain S-box-containing protein
VAKRKESDAYIARLQGLGDELHVQISSATPSQKRIEVALEQVRAVDAGVKPLEEAFTATLGQAVWRLRFALTWSVSAIISILVVLGIYLTARILVRTRRAEEGYRLLANAIAHTADGIMILDSGRRIVAVNHAFTRITGYAPEEVVGHLLTRPQTLKFPGPTLYSICGCAERVAGRRGLERAQDGRLYTMRLEMSAVHDERHDAVSQYIAVFNTSRHTRPMSGSSTSRPTIS